MPLILLTGYPRSGKTYRANQLASHINGLISTAAHSDPPNPHLSSLTVHVVSPHSLSLPTSSYATAASEKAARGAEYSAIKRLLSPKTVVIADSLNYIKGFRYQLYCEAKAAGTTNCVIHIGTPISQCRSNNTIGSSGDPSLHYPDDIFENLITRYEEPSAAARWDSPLFTVLWDDAEPPYSAIWDTLVKSDGSAKTVKMHQATVLKRQEARRGEEEGGRKKSARPFRKDQEELTDIGVEKPAAPPPDSLTQLTTGTQEIVTQLLAIYTENPSPASPLKLEGVDTLLPLPASPPSLPMLQRLRRQYLLMARGAGNGMVVGSGMNKVGQRPTSDRVKEGFVGFLAGSFREDE